MAKTGTHQGFNERRRSGAESILLISVQYLSNRSNLNGQSPAMNVLLTTVLLCWSSAAVSESWPEYRGPTGNGHAAVPTVPLAWSEESNVRWKTKIHDEGWATPVILGNQVWLTTALANGKEMYVVCVDRKTGKVLLDRKLFDVASPRPLGNDLNCYASPSPTIEAGRVYVSFGSYGIACLDTVNFRVIWERRDLTCNHFRGPASSLFLSGELVITHMDGADYQYIVALRKDSGETVWKTQRSTDYRDLGEDGKPIAKGDYRKGFNTPISIEVAGQKLLISPASKAVYAYRPDTGDEIWQIPYDGHSTAVRTLFDGRNVFINSGSGKTELLAVDPLVSTVGDQPRILWRLSKHIPKRSSPVLVDDLIYSCTDGGVVSCIDKLNGNTVWRQRVGGEFSASLLYAAGRIYLCNQDGMTLVIEPGNQFKLLAENHLETGMMASPVALGNALYLRTKTHLYRIEE